MEEKIYASQNIILENRKKLTLTGVKDVVSFDEETIVLSTSLGRLTIKGNMLHILNFETQNGDLTAEGKFIAIAYTSDEKNSSFMSRLFR